MHQTIAAALILLPAEAMAQDATARLLGADGTDHGTAAFWAAPEGLVLRVEATGLPPGPHGLHIHETGSGTPNLDAAGDHFAPEGRQHGFLNPDGPHVGDLPILHAGPTERHRPTTTVD